jgi:ABC-type molybdate transport system substrate-binding protein
MVPRRDFRRLAGWIAAFFFAAMTPAASNAEEIKLLAAGALRQTISELLPQFEKDARHRVSAAYGPIGALTDRLAKGEAADDDHAG